MTDFTEHQDVINLLAKTQEADSDMRDVAREVHNFLDKKDGQWEPGILKSFSDAGIPRYTFDQCNDIVDDIAGELEQTEFGVIARPAGGEADEDTAEVYDGLIRNIQAVSYADDIYDAAGRNMIAAGFDAWRINQRYGDGDSFDQDLFIDAIPNAIDSVWIDPTAFSPAPRKAGFAFVLEAMSKEDYKKRWPDGSGQSVNTDVTRQVYSHKPNVIVVGELLYREATKRTIVEMSDGAIYEDNEDFKKVKKELRAKGVTERRRRDREIMMVKSRLFDGSDWLTDPQDTVFQFIPIVPVYGNFKVTENKITYWGKITKKLDPQRVYNYAVSKKVADGVLQPRPKITATPEQVAAHKSDWENINTSTKAVVLRTHVDGQTDPYMLGGPTVDPNLEVIGNDALTSLQSNRPQIPGQPLGLRSGTAVELEQNKEDTKNYKYFKAMQIAISYTGEVLIDAIPRVYDTKRTVRILGEDGVGSMVTVNDSVLDNDTQQMVELNNLARGEYDIRVDVAPMFKNRQQETVKAFTELAQIDPTILAEGGDIYLSNINAPGMDAMAQRKRARLFQAGEIPEDQWTDEEREQAQLAAQNAPPPPPDPLMIAAQAEMVDKQNDAARIQQEGQVKDRELKLKQEELRLKGIELQGKQQSAEIQAVLDANKQLNANLSTQISGLKDLIEAFGIQVMGGTEPAKLIAQQGANIDQTQKEELQ